MQITSSFNYPLSDKNSVYKQKMYRRENKTIEKDIENTEQVNSTQIKNETANSKKRNYSNLATLKNSLHELDLKVKDMTKHIRPKLLAITAFVTSILLYSSTIMVPVVFCASFGAGTYGAIAASILIFASASANPYTLGALIGAVAAAVSVLFLAFAAALMIALLTFGALALAIQAVKIANACNQYALDILFQQTDGNQK